MPYNTPYNRIIAENENKTNERYAQYNAYSNELYDSPLPFSQVYKEIRPPLRQFCPQPFHRVSNYNGGITERNMEGGYSAWDSFKVGFLAPWQFLNDPEGAIKDPNKTFVTDVVGEGGRSSKPMSGEGDKEYEDPAQFKESSKEAQAKEAQKKMKQLQKQRKMIKKMAKEQDGKEGIYASMSCDTIGSDCSSSGSDSDFEDPIKTNMTEMRPPRPTQPKPQPPRPTQPKPRGLGKGTRKPSDWIQFVKAYSKKHNMSYKEAMKCPKGKAQYAKLKKEYKGRGMTGGFWGVIASALLPTVVDKAVDFFGGGDKDEDDEMAGLTQGIERMMGERSKSAPPAAPASAIAKPTPRKGDKPKRKAKSPSSSPEVEQKSKKSKHGGSVLGGPSNDPVNKGKIGGQKYMKSTGLKWEGATLGAGKKTKKTGSALFKTTPVVPLDIKSGIPPSEEQIEGIHDSKEVQGNGKKGGMLKSEMQGSTFSGGAKKTSKWITHVKAYAKQHGVKYGEALKLAKASYKK